MDAGYIEDGELQCALPRQPSCEYTTTFDALRFAGWDAGARATVHAPDKSPGICA